VRYDDEYGGEGTCNLFMFFEPLQGGGMARSPTDALPKTLPTVERPGGYPLSEGGRDQCVLDNLNIHTPAALYATFPTAEAWRI
jgi:hypothetical protein